MVAHEIAHIALRHGTHNASKAYAAQAGIGVLGGILTGGKTRSTAQIINVIGGLGLNAVFLKYSRDAETQADIVGTQILSRAGYDPMDMANFFEVLRKQHAKEPGRAGAVHQQPSLPRQSLRAGAAGSPAPRARPAPAAPPAGSPASSPSCAGCPRAARWSRSPGARERPGAARPRPGAARPPGAARCACRWSPRPRGSPPSGSAAISSSSQHPDNWRAYAAENGFGVTIVPEGGIVETGDGQQSIVYGVVVNHYDPFEGGSPQRTTLDGALTDLTAQIRQSNTHLRSTGSVRRETIDGQPARSLVLSGPSPVTGDEERVTVFARQMGDDHIIYALFIAPGRDYPTLSRTFTQMMNSMRVNDDAAHAVNQD